MTYPVKELAQNTNASELSNLLESDKFGIISVMSYANGESINDGVTDATTAIQNALSAANNNGGGTVYFLVGTYLVTGTLTLYKNVKIVGVTFNANSSESSVTISHEPTSAGTDLFVTDTAQAFGYISGISIIGLMVTGTSNSRYAFNLASPSNLLMRHVYIHDGFDEGLYLDETINCRFEFVDIDYMDTVCVRFTGGVSTSTTFNNCYFHFTPTPIIIEKERAVGITFTDHTIFESCVNGIDIHTGNHVDFIGCYAENIPTTNTDIAIINLGINGTDESVYVKGTCNVIGGLWKGNNVSYGANSKIFNVDRWASLNVVGVYMATAGYTIARTANTLKAQFYGCYEESINNLAVNTNYVTSFGSNNAGVNYPNTISEILRLKAYNGKSWDFYTDYVLTNADLQIINKSKAGGQTIPFMLDARDNIHMNSGDLDPETAEYMMLFKAKAATMGTLGNIGGIGCVTEDSASVIKLYHGTGRNGQIQVSSNSTTANRPTTGKAIGVMHFDTTINKPIWWQGTKWVLADGTDAP